MPKIQPQRLLSPAYQAVTKNNQPDDEKGNVPPQPVPAPSPQPQSPKDETGQIQNIESPSPQQEDKLKIPTPLPKAPSTKITFPKTFPVQHPGVPTGGPYGGRAGDFQTPPTSPHGHSVGGHGPYGGIPSFDPRTGGITTPGPVHLPPGAEHKYKKLIDFSQENANRQFVGWKTNNPNHYVWTSPNIEKLENVRNKLVEAYSSPNRDTNQKLLDSLVQGKVQSVNLIGKDGKTQIEISREEIAPLLQRNQQGFWMLPSLHQITAMILDAEARELVSKSHNGLSYGDAIELVIQGRQGNLTAEQLIGELQLRREYQRLKALGLIHGSGDYNQQLREALQRYRQKRTEELTRIFKSMGINPEDIAGPQWYAPGNLDKLRAWLAQLSLGVGAIPGFFGWITGNQHLKDAEKWFQNLAGEMLLEMMLENPGRLPRMPLGIGRAGVVYDPKEKVFKVVDPSVIGAEMAIPIPGINLAAGGIGAAGRYATKTLKDLAENAPRYLDEMAERIEQIFGVPRLSPAYATVPSGTAPARPFTPPHTTPGGAPSLTREFLPNQPSMAAHMVQRGGEAGSGGLLPPGAGTSSHTGTGGASHTGTGGASHTGTGGASHTGAEGKGGKPGGTPGSGATGASRVRILSEILDDFKNGLDGSVKSKNEFINFAKNWSKKSQSIKSELQRSLKDAEEKLSKLDNLLRTGISQEYARQYYANLYKLWQSRLRYLQTEFEIIKSLDTYLQASKNLLSNFTIGKISADGLKHEELGKQVLEQLTKYGISIIEKDGRLFAVTGSDLTKLLSETNLMKRVENVAELLNDIASRKISDQVRNNLTTILADPKNAKLIENFGKNLDESLKNLSDLLRKNADDINPIITEVGGSRLTLLTPKSLGEGLKLENVLRLVTETGSTGQELSRLSQLGILLARGTLETVSSMPGFGQLVNTLRTTASLALKDVQNPFIRGLLFWSHGPTTTSRILTGFGARSAIASFIRTQTEDLRQDQGEKGLIGKYNTPLRDLFGIVPVFKLIQGGYPEAVKDIELGLLPAEPFIRIYKAIPSDDAWSVMAGWLMITRNVSLPRIVRETHNEYMKAAEEYSNYMNSFFDNLYGIYMKNIAQFIKKDENGREIIDWNTLVSLANVNTGAKNELRERFMNDQELRREIANLLSGMNREINARVKDFYEKRNNFQASIASRNNIPFGLGLKESDYIELLMDNRLNSILEKYRNNDVQGAINDTINLMFSYGYNNLIASQSTADRNSDERKNIEAARTIVEKTKRNMVRTNVDNVQENLSKTLDALYTLTQSKEQIMKTVEFRLNKDAKLDDGIKNEIRQNISDYIDAAQMVLSGLENRLNELRDNYRNSGTDHDSYRRAINNYEKFRNDMTILLSRKATEKEKNEALGRIVPQLANQQSVQDEKQKRINKYAEEIMVELAKYYQNNFINGYVFSHARLAAQRPTLAYGHEASRLTDQLVNSMINEFESRQTSQKK